LIQLSEEEMRQVRGKRISMILQDPQTSLNPVFNIGNQLVESQVWAEKRDGKV
jgi:peptide/nickel transport system ATP-binding protein